MDVTIRGVDETTMMVLNHLAKKEGVSVAKYVDDMIMENMVMEKGLKKINDALDDFESNHEKLIEQMEEMKKLAERLLEKKKGGLNNGII